MEITGITEKIKTQAQSLGFSMAAVCPAVSPPGVSQLDSWLASGFAGEMHYIADRRDAYDDPGKVLAGAKSIVMLAMDYRTQEPMPIKTGQGRISRYAWGTTDYHDLIRTRLNSLAGFIEQRAPNSTSRGVVDTAPLMEREFAQLAGLGWVGKNTLLLNQQQGSWFFLAALLTDVELEYDTPFEHDHCGTCRACLDACPTDAFPEPYVLDASRCISYLTIELKGAMPAELRGGIGDWVFGCDVCQDVCPWNRATPTSSEPVFAPLPENNPLDLLSLFDMQNEDFRQRFRQSPMWRPKRRGILRNAAIVLGNQGNPRAVPALTKGLNDSEPLIRGACAWALGQLPGQDRIAVVLAQRCGEETDAEVLLEIENALENHKQTAIRIDEACVGKKES